MKFTIAVVMLAAVSAQAGFVPITSYTVPYAPLPIAAEHFPVASPHFPVASPHFPVASPHFPVASPHLRIAAAPLHSSFYSSWPFAARSIPPYTYATTGAVPLHFDDHRPVIHTIPNIHTVAIPSPSHVPILSDGTYTAVNKGAVHVAPLPGHGKSISAINLQPAAPIF